MASPKLAGLLVRVAGAAGAAPSAAALGAAAAPLRALGLDGLEPLFEAPAGAPGLGAAPEPPATWFRAGLATAGGGSPWDLVHEAAASGLGLAGGGEVYLEPDLEQTFVAARPAGLAAAAGKGVADPPDPDLPFRDRFAWFLDDEFSQLRSARRAAGGGPRVRVAHLDTGYDAAHVTRPAGLATGLERNFVEGEAAGDARDPGRDEFGPLDNPGHGTGTLGILAGARIDELQDFLGGAPEAEIIPVRIAKSVVLLRTGALARALDYAAAAGPGGARLADVVSLSMGGVASRAWADAVNKAYEAGVCIVAAAGNNFSAGLGGVPSRFIVYPARFRRVIAACGVMADRRPYYGLPFGRMQGNWGPPSKMATALAAFTPNIPWAELGSPRTIDLDGAGTSSSTPQVAAAAALWLARHRAAVERYPRPWQRVEAVRHALFTSAEKTADGGKSEKLGNGILQAARALAVEPIQDLAETPRDSATFAFLNVLAGLGVAAPTPQTEMLALEATQLVQLEAAPGEPNRFEEILSDPDLPASAISPAERRRFVEALVEHPRASRALKAHLKQTYRSVYGAPPARRARKTRAAQQPAAEPRPAPRAAYAGEPAHRRLRGYALDPSLALRLETAPVSTVTFAVPWEQLSPGPVGEYLEVVDYDPASKCFYEPVDLDDPKLLAQDGLPPSDGTPQFHQQMVYAVASLTIRNFERALGRKALWAPGPPPPRASPRNDSHFVRRLRIHPHALRGANAYYSPAKKALLFGYYPASADDPGDHLPGGMVFTCLSHDVVAHETTHALLDGMHRRFIYPSNPDVLAFHEAFADIVALFQHFTLPEILRHQMARTRGDIRSQQSVLGELAGEFGRTTGMGGALRSAIGERDAQGAWRPKPADAGEYQSVFEPHHRGAILVAAVFDAFLAIYERRVADLLRLATGGSGVLPPGAIPPDLVNRLSEAAAKAAGHVLAMCVRALDYCPPTDLTFGEYLRALVTADCDLVRDDDMGYRVAFIEAFRRRGIYPRDVRTLSVQSLRWCSPEHDEHRASQQLLAGLEKLRDRLPAQAAGGSREEIFHLGRDVRRAMHGWLRDHFAGRAPRPGDAAFLGIDPARDFEVHSLRVANRVGPDGDLLRQIIIEILQEAEVPIDSSDAAGRQMALEGGCSIVADLQRLAIDYCIRKNVASTSRRERQRDFVSRFAVGSLHATYFGDAATQREPVARLHGGG
jgi:hypothetical protein